MSKTPAEDRRARVAAALRDNLKRRKVQARERRAGAEVETEARETADAAKHSQSRTE